MKNAHIFPAAPSLTTFSHQPNKIYFPKAIKPRNKINKTTITPSEKITFLGQQCPKSEPWRFYLRPECSGWRIRLRLLTWILNWTHYGWISTANWTCPHPNRQSKQLCIDNRSPRLLCKPPFKLFGRVNGKWIRKWWNETVTCESEICSNEKENWRRNVEAEAGLWAGAISSYNCMNSGSGLSVYLVQC